MKKSLLEIEDLSLQDNVKKLGKNAIKDDLCALKFLTQLAEQDEAEAQTVLGIMYYHGEGVTKDYIKSYMWFYSATSQQGYRTSPKLIMLEKIMTPTQISEAKRLSKKLKAKKIK